VNIDLATFVKVITTSHHHQNLHPSDPNAPKSPSTIKKLAQVMKCIKEIDKDNNGYVTSQELDDIFKLIYPEEFGDKDLKRVFRGFSSIQNTILIDYKRLRDYLVEEIDRTKDENLKVKGSEDRGQST
jgi:hypothetical protein